MRDEFVNAFVEEVKELLIQLEDSIILLEKEPTNPDIINSIFRVMHTLKGTAGMVGFRNIQDLTHEFESLYSELREGKRTADSEIIDLTLQAKDMIQNMLSTSGEDINTDFLGIIKEKIGSYDQIEANPSSDDGDGESHIYIIVFSPDKGIFERGIDPDKTLADIKSQGDTFIVPVSGKKSWEKQKTEKICQTVWEIYLRTNLKITDIESSFLFYDRDEFSMFKVSEIKPGDSTLSNLLSRIHRNKIDPEVHINDCIAKIPFERARTDAVILRKPLTPKQVLSEIHNDTDAGINVSSQKLDELMNLVSELVTFTANMQVQVSRLNDSKLNNAFENIEKLTKKFRNNALDLRLVPVETLLSRFKRQIRDLSRELGKKVNLLIEGQDIEIDKTILRSIESPLQHIIRNSIDHGIEPESERISKGKEPEGLLKITAFYSGASVILQIQDDGSGINLDRVKECAIKRGYIQADQVVSKEDLLGFIMEPGFTTSENVSMVSGRGVGMDVVRKELNGVGGSLEIFTEKDLGTSIIMKLPMTLTIIDTLLVNVGETQVLIPVMDVEYCFMENTNKLFRKDNKYIEYKNCPIPLVSLRHQFRYERFMKDEVMVIVINKFERRYAITVDEILGEHQAVIKPLGELFVNQFLFSGGSIMADGKMAFILDTNFLFNHITKI
ncbi:MAG TPA: chemotaxis protein CheA [Bacteroidales bacterium]|jgi:two-component system chemotaxis sensor kinase CheA|nr:chemotaxis protein CheA [Bacteroidales bacterium]